MGKPISQIKEDYDDFIWTSDFELEQRFSRSPNFSLTGVQTLVWQS